MPAFLASVSISTSYECKRIPNLQAELMKTKLFVTRLGPFFIVITLFSLVFGRKKI